MLSAINSLISTNWPDLILSALFWGKRSAAGDRTSPVGAPGPRVGVADQVTEVGRPIPKDCCVVGGHPVDGSTGRDTVMGGRVPGDGWLSCGGSCDVILLLLVRRGTEAMATGGGSAPRTGEAQVVAIR